MNIHINFPTFGRVNSGMMKKGTLAALLVLLVVSSLPAQAAGDPDFMRSIGKMYVVVAVIITVFLGIVAFLIYLDRRLTKLEDQIKEPHE